jgi:hypothetical protein
MTSTLSVLLWLMPTVLASSFWTDYTGTLKDYSCYHQQSWQENTDRDYTSQFSAYTDITTSKYVSSRRRLQGPPPPSGGGGGGGGGGTPSGSSTSAPTSPLLTTGWEMKSTSIPKYNHNVTTFDMYLLNARPKKSSDFATGVTTAYKGEIVTFGESVGYSVTQGCTSSGYWPEGPRCPTSQSIEFVFPTEPAPETSTGMNHEHC